MHSETKIFVKCTVNVNCKQLKQKQQCLFDLTNTEIMTKYL